MEGNILFGLNIHKKKMKIQQTRDSYESVITHMMPEQTRDSYESVIAHMMPEFAPAVICVMLDFRHATYKGSQKIICT